MLGKSLGKRYDTCMLFGISPHTSCIPKILPHVCDHVQGFYGNCQNLPSLKNAEERSDTKNYYPVSLLSVIFKVFQKFEMWPFSDFQYDFRCSWSTADLLVVVFGRIVRAFDKHGAIQAVVLDLSEVFNRV